jgi:hypothetical protein
VRRLPGGHESAVGFSDASFGRVLGGETSQRCRPDAPDDDTRHRRSSLPRQSSHHASVASLVACSRASAADERARCAELREIRGQAFEGGNRRGFEMGRECEPLAYGTA